MRIGIDIRALQSASKYRGIGFYITDLLQAISMQDRTNEYVFFLEKGKDDPLSGIGLDTGFKYVVERVAAGRLGSIKYIRTFAPTSSVVSAKDYGVNVFFQPDFMYGIPRGVPTVVTFHDLIPYLYRVKSSQKYYKGLSKQKVKLAEELMWRRYLRYLNSLKKATEIIAISESSKHDLLKYVSGLDKKSIQVVPHGITQLKQGPKKSSFSLSKLDIEKPFLLYVGAIDYRKNVVGLAEMFYELKKDFPDLQLVLVGKEFTNKLALRDIGWYEKVENNKFYSDVKMLGFVDTATLHGLYASAELFAFPSKYEGFGLPILEAMQAGCPVVTFNNSSIPEVAGGAAILADNEQEFVKAVSVVLKDPAARNRLIQLGHDQAKKFTWDKAARQTLAVIHSAIKKEV